MPGRLTACGSVLITGELPARRYGLHGDLVVTVDWRCMAVCVASGSGAAGLDMETTVVFCG